MKIGFEGQVFIGAKGSTANTLVTNRVDYGTDTDPQMAPTTVAGAGTAPPVETEGVATIKFSATLKMKNVAGDATLALLRTAAAIGGAVALREKDVTDGKGYDGDVNVKQSFSAALNGEQTFDFTFTPNGMSRAPKLYV